MSVPAEPPPPWPSRRGEVAFGVSSALLSASPLDAMQPLLCAVVAAWGLGSGPRVAGATVPDAGSRPRVADAPAFPLVRLPSCQRDSL